MTHSLKLILASNKLDVTEDTFSNVQVNVETIPSVSDIEYLGLDKNYLTAELASTGIFWLIFGSTAFVFIYLNLWNLPSWASTVLYATLLLFIVTSFLFVYLGFKKKKYALRTRDIIYQSGLLWRRFTVLPFNRVQHAEVEQGPIERLFDLSKIKIYTAGGSSSDLSISGLPLHTAQSIKHYILHQTSLDEEE